MKSALIAACEKFDSIDQINSHLSNELRIHCPVIEDMHNNIDNKLVSFIYEGTNLQTVSLYSPLLGNFPKKMERLDDTNWFYFTLVVPVNIRVTYAFIENDLVDYDHIQTKDQSLSVFIEMWSKLKPDKCNTKRITLKTGNPRVIINTSILEMPFAPSLNWSQKKDLVPKGGVHKEEIYSTYLQSTRDYWVYLPIGYSNSENYPLLIVFDGQFYHESGIPLPTIIDNLIHEKMIPPIIAVLIDSVGFDMRAKDFRSESFSDFIINEMIPEITSKYSISNDCYDRILMGASLGGYISLYLSLKHPGTFGNVISQSDGDETILSLIKKSINPLNIYLDIGSTEQSENIDKIYKLLSLAGNKVIYKVIPGAHDLVSWETAIPDALIKLLK